MRLRIERTVEEAVDVKTFILQPLDGSAYTYKAGQFITLIDHRHGHEERRSYSLSSAPVADALPAITVKRVPNGLVSRWLCDRAVAGNELDSTGQPTGLFTLPEDRGHCEAIWLFAAGIGITPVFSMLKDALYRTRLRVVLVYSSRSREQTVFYDQLCALRDGFSNRFSICWLWSDAQDLRRARLSRESFAALLSDLLTQPVTGVQCYTCGPARYMWLVQLLLQEAGVPGSAIRREVFAFDKYIPRNAPPDVASHWVGIGHQAFLTQYPETILQAAKRQGISLPYSCEAGQCGSCTAICTSGQVWMSYNEVLTDADIAAGRVLTCTGYPVFGDITLRY